MSTPSRQARYPPEKTRAIFQAGWVLMAWSIKPVAHTSNRGAAFGVMAGAVPGHRSPAPEW
ncbi:hypothetical protein ACQPZ8_01245 [Actinomadura nitritigenes]|uniref:hypothetical protein n=1 Tax=Actinomadura nitritigenes TaxID=134602 RepID=UPI003D92BD81